jgi:hypothetical protein
MSTWGSTTNFNDVHFHAPGRVQVNGAGIDFLNIEAESSFQLRAITRNNAFGGQKIVGYMMELSLTIPNNKYTDHRADFLMLQQSGLTDLDITFQAFEDGGGNDDMKIDAGLSNSVTAKTNTLMHFSCTGWTIEQVERRPRMRITFKALYSVRLFEETVLPQFIQYL